MANPFRPFSQVSAFPADYEARRDHTVRWGDTRTLITTSTAGLVIGEFLRVDLPAPRVCALTLYAELAPESASTVIYATGFDVFIGVGASQLTLHYGFATAPQALQPLYLVVPDISLNHIHISASLLAPIPGTKIRLTAQLSPVVPVE